MKQKSFTLIELLVVIVIIGILAGVITLSVNSAITKAQDTKISSSILSINKIIKGNSILSFPVEATPCNLKDSCTNLKSKVEIPKVEDNIYYVTSTSGDYFALYGAKKSDTTSGFKIDSNSEKVSEAVVDSRDNNGYKVITIGTQTWMAENLKYLPSVVGPATGSTSDPYQYVYNYNGTDVSAAKATNNYKTYGVLYNWEAAMAACPAGWHLPSDDEFKTLEMHLGMSQEQADATDYRGTDEGDKLKEAGTSHWTTGNTGTNTSGFTALGAGLRDTENSFSGLVSSAYFWSSSYSSSTAALCHVLRYSIGTVYRNSLSRARGFSVRCIKD